MASAAALETGGVRVVPSGASLGCRIEGIDLAKPLSDTDLATILKAFGRHAVRLLSRASRSMPPQHKAFARRFGSLEINVAAGHYTVPGHPEVMILSNIVENGQSHRPRRCRPGLAHRHELFGDDRLPQCPARPEGAARAMAWRSARPSSSTWRRPTTTCRPT